jgi:hypothetical protein
MAKPRSGVISKIWARRVAVIPAKVGTYSVSLRKCPVNGLDSRFRGNGRRFERVPSGRKQAPKTGKGLESRLGGGMLARLRLVPR